MFALLEALVRQIMYPIWNVRLKLLANKASMKIINLKVVMSS